MSDAPRFGAAGLSDSFAAGGWQKPAGHRPLPRRLWPDRLRGAVRPRRAHAAGQSRPAGRQCAAENIALFGTRALLHQHEQPGGGQAPAQRGLPAAKLRAGPGAGRPAGHLPRRQLRQAEPGGRAGKGRWTPCAAPSRRWTPPATATASSAPKRWHGEPAGTLDEVLALCGVDSRITPCVDFGHLYAAAPTAASPARRTTPPSWTAWPRHWATTGR